MASMSPVQRDHLSDVGNVEASDVSERSITTPVRTSIVMALVRTVTMDKEKGTSEKAKMLCKPKGRARASTITLAVDLIPIIVVLPSATTSGMYGHKDGRVVPGPFV